MRLPERPYFHAGTIKNIKIRRALFHPEEKQQKKKGISSSYSKISY
jgi:hypothetical protein